jgi:hypothetical protein
VPGPPVPLYLAGAKMLTNYPCSIVVHGVALNITVQSYDQSLDFGLMADAVAAPDIAALADALRVALDDLRVLAGTRDADEAAAAAAAEGAGFVGRAARRLRDAVGTAVGSAARQVGARAGSRLGATLASTLASRLASDATRGLVSGTADQAGKVLASTAARAQKAVKAATTGAAAVAAAAGAALPKETKRTAAPTKRAAVKRTGAAPTKQAAAPAKRRKRGAS